MKNLNKRLLYILVILTILISSCKKEDDFNTDGDAKLQFSTDLITFDTVFTTITTSTKQFVVYNNENKTLKISSIRLSNTNNSYFSLNINGRATNAAYDVEIPAKDSIYIFVKATINANNQNNPLLIKDSIIFETNGNIQDVDIVACGQDAHFIIGDSVFNEYIKYKIVAREGESITWTNDKPYVVYGYAVVDSTAQLTIENGCKIYFHKNSGLWVYKGGGLKVLGTYENPVTFQGDRREEWYKDVPGQWDRIWLNESNFENEINYAIIKNGFIGIQTEILGTAMAKNKLLINNTIIMNMSGIGIFSRNYNIDGINNSISNCGQYCIALTLGGEYKFIHNTIANYWSGSIRNTPALYINNYFINNNITYLNDLNAEFGNTIIYGNNSNELEIDKNEGAILSTNFNNCILKTTLNNSNFVECIKNSDPLFKNYSEQKFYLQQTSPAKDKGNPLYYSIAPFDLRQYARDAVPDIGAYEFDPNLP